jgi:hypothetical protein
MSATVQTAKVGISRARAGRPIAPVFVSMAGRDPCRIRGRGSVRDLVVLRRHERLHPSGRV